MSSTENRSDSDRTCVINAGIDKCARDAVNSRRWEVAHKFDGHVGVFTRAWYALIKNGSNGGAGPENPKFVSQ